MGPFFLTRPSIYFSTEQTLVHGSTGHMAGLGPIPEMAE